MPIEANVPNVEPWIAVPVRAAEPPPHGLVRLVDLAASPPAEPLLILVALVAGLAAALAALAASL